MPQAGRCPAHDRPGRCRAASPPGHGATSRAARRSRQGVQTVPRPFAQPGGLGALGAADLLLQSRRGNARRSSPLPRRRRASAAARACRSDANAMQHRHRLVFARRRAGGKAALRPVGRARRRESAPPSRRAYPPAPRRAVGMKRAEDADREGRCRPTTTSTNGPRGLPWLVSLAKADSHGVGSSRHSQHAGRMGRNGSRQRQRELDRVHHDLSALPQGRPRLVRGCSRRRRPAAATSRRWRAGGRSRPGPASCPGRRRADQRLPVGPAARTMTASHKPSRRRRTGPATAPSTACAT